MHRLDSLINDIEPRIKAVYENAPREEEPSLQEALIAYGWIMLDSWICWRTLRFLLQETYIDEAVNEKWFQTPSSYNASQLRAVWKFTDDVLEYIEQAVGQSFKHLINDVIQQKRNSSAHFSRQNEIKGSDSQEIKKIYYVFSKVFLMYENIAFQKKLLNSLKSLGFNDFTYCYPGLECFSISEFDKTIDNFSKADSFSLYCRKDSKDYMIIYEKNGCRAGLKMTEDAEYELYDVINSEHQSYYFLNNKGFYLFFDLFFETLVNIWKV